MMDKAAVIAGKLLVEKGMKLATAESCTGGLLAHMVTNVAGSSSWFAGGVVAYGNDVKTSLLSVDPETLERHGTVSHKTARAMASGVMKRLKSDAALAVTGIAGPGGGSATKPVGTVFVAVAVADRVRTKKVLLKGTRKSIKKQAALEALKELTEFLTL